ncbi:MAG TPA: 2,3-bisphosphoglycerate-independent phosphoglycerate mutase [Candidatus Fimousia stercorigallinarum]|nr:2,3-bisphosphoglycerate-independent phosphoglycerate mutase [Candidatus Fimousia stercorigallinarum]
MGKRPTVLMILDGYGLSDKTEGNAIALAKTPVMDKLMAECPFQKGYASGMAVGLPDGQMGNSEVGHMNIGAGRIIYQDLTLITKMIEDGSFFENKVLLTAIENCKKNGSDLHCWGLLSDGGVHSHNTHLYGILEMCKKEGLDRVYVHPFLDGRDTPPESAKDYVQELVDKMAEIGVGKVATLSGRYYAMDRDTNWDRVEKAYAAIVYGEGEKATDPVQAMADSYANGVTDEFVVPTVIEEDGKPVATVKENDSVIFFNFRPDRAREITRAFCDDEFTGFERRYGRMPLTYVCFKDYDETIPNKLIAFEKPVLKNTLGEYLADKGLKQLRIAETEKYAHVTFFFNGGVEEPNKDETRILVKSPAVATYDLQPEMSAPEVGEKLNAAITSGEYDMIVVNFANPDMVGHTGVIDAAIKAVERIDEIVGYAVEAVKEADGAMFICADHGNADQMIDYETGAPFTAHTTNPIPFILVNCPDVKDLKKGGRLCDIAPTLLDVMGLPQPEEMTGISLLER